MAANSFCRIALRRLVAPTVSHRILSARPTNGIATNSVARFFTLSVLRDHNVDGGIDHRMPVTRFTEDEEMVRDAARAWANQELKPFVREMDDECKTRPEVIQGLFDHGFMGLVGVIIMFYKIFVWTLRDVLILVPSTYLHRKFQKNGVAQE
jgi:hypothetical protein